MGSPGTKPAVPRQSWLHLKGGLITFTCNDGSLVIFQICADSTKEVISSPPEVLIIEINAEQTNMQERGRNVRESGESFC